MNFVKKFLELNGSRKSKIVVVGDSMLDQYHDVHIRRISPEFPIPICLSETQESRDFPGGASNVSYQFRHFNVESNLGSFVDNEADALLRARGLDTSCCVAIPGQIPRKKRFYSDDFPTYRWDVETARYGFSGSDLDSKCRELFWKVLPRFPECDVVVFSDYSKGVFDSFVHRLVPLAPLSIVDPKAGDIKRWRGCTIFKPNSKEALALTGCDNEKDAGLKLLKELDCLSVVITCGGDGVWVCQDGQAHFLNPGKTLQSAASVIGAGDCFTAFLAMAMACGMTVQESVHVAWKAGTLYVQNRHNKPITPMELLRSQEPIEAKIVRAEDLALRDYRLALTCGCFDMFHAGHLESLKFARGRADKLAVLVNSDSSVRTLKGEKRPIISLKDRMDILANLECVDFVIPFDSQTPLEEIGKIRPDVLVKGSEYDKDKIVGAEFAGETITCKMVSGVSTTGIFNRIKEL